MHLTSGKQKCDWNLESWKAAVESWKAGKHKAGKLQLKAGKLESIKLEMLWKAGKLERINLEMQLKAGKPKSSICIYFTNPISWYLYIYIYMDFKIFKKAGQPKSSIWIHFTNPISWYLFIYIWISKSSRKLDNQSHQYEYILPIQFDDIYYIYIYIWISNSSRKLENQSHQYECIWPIQFDDIYVYMDFKFLKTPYHIFQIIYIYIYMDLKSFYICLILIFSLHLIVLYKRSCQRNWRITTVGELPTPSVRSIKGSLIVQSMIFILFSHYYWVL